MARRRRRLCRAPCAAPCAVRFHAPRPYLTALRSGALTLQKNLNIPLPLWFLRSFAPARSTIGLVVVELTESAGDGSPGPVVPSRETTPRRHRRAAEALGGSPRRRRADARRKQQARGVQE
eukprot:scaffold19940_cov124-Isochrysis_galbana.AAC.6